MLLKWECGYLQQCTFTRLLFDDIQWLTFAVLYIVVGGILSFVLMIIKFVSQDESDAPVVVILSFSMQVKCLHN